MHIYAFGSVVRGDVTASSDIDLLAVTDGHDSRFDPAQYSIYSYERLAEMWLQGTPFAWHLAQESRLLFAGNGVDYLGALGKPAPYMRALEDCQKFAALFAKAKASLIEGTSSSTFELSNIFLAVRNFATCYSLGVERKADFSRNSAMRLGLNSLRMNSDAYRVIERARMLSTRGVGKDVNDAEECFVKAQLQSIDDWMENLMDLVKKNERVREQN